MNRTQELQPVTEDSVIAYLGMLLTELLELEPEHIDPDLPLSAYGINSMTSTWLTGELERWSGVSLRAELMFDRPSIAEVAQEVTTLLTPRPGTATG
jgi:acyl carrier protein